ncbi:hypothetical protein [Mycobacterium sp. OTB74]|uniref:hypothetical protein n=1 Tax=Mycobacterium sp. OTB74 TaxID=1853452 RepID=UPI0024759B8E|nr:hypothetical protein [Mycobacterium sp. OTB74]MDH6247373.1 hypothetical protein [Mycobacterium sp. OTB74]
MDVVLGVVLTSQMAGLTVSTSGGADNAVLDHAAVYFDHKSSYAAQLADAVRQLRRRAVRRRCRLRSIAVTWTADADQDAVRFSELLAELGMGTDLVPIPLAAASTALVADNGYTDTAICVIEPDVASAGVMRGRVVIANLDGPRLSLAHFRNDGSATHWLTELFDDYDRQPRLFVVGGDDNTKRHLSGARVAIESRTESMTALAHGAALAARCSDGVVTHSRPVQPRRPRKMVSWSVPPVAAAVCIGALVAAMPLGWATGPHLQDFRFAPAPPAVNSAPPAPASSPGGTAQPQLPPPPLPSSAATPVVPAPSADDAEVIQKQNQSDTSTPIPDARRHQESIPAAPLQPAPLGTAPELEQGPGGMNPHPVDRPDNCLALCGFVL